MRLQKLSRLFLAVALVVSFPTMFAGTSIPDASLGVGATAPSKVCHPKKPITCRAGELAVSPDAATIDLSVGTADSQQAALCFGPRWLCRAGADVATPSDIGVAPEATTPEPQQLSTDSKVESQQAALCFGPRWLCRSGADLTTPSDIGVSPETTTTEPRQLSTDSKVQSQQAALCFGPRWLCKANALI